MKILFTILLLTTFNLSAQKDIELFHENFVECYYSEKTTEPILIYDRFNGKIIIALKPLKDMNCWCKFTVSESKNGWLKIQNITVLSACRNNDLNKNIELYKDNWVLATNMKINISDLDVDPKIGLKFYKKPDQTSDISYQSGKFLETELLEINGGWAKVSFTVNETLMTGWLQRKDQCAYPWTSCPYAED